MEKKYNINFIANLIGTVWSMIANFIFVPLYIKYLGEESYGLITFFATMQVFLNVLGLGLSKTLRREFSNPNYDSNTKYKYLRSIETIYYGILLIIVVAITLLSNFIAFKWLNIESLDLEVVSNTIKLMGGSIGIQLVAGLYYGCFLGLEKHVKANAIHVGWSLFKNVFAIVFVVFVSRSILTFYIVNLICDIIYLLVLRIWLVVDLRKDQKLSYSFKDFKLLKKISKYALGLMFVSIAYSINTQLDKIIISKYFSVIELGAYNSGCTLARLISTIPSAIALTMFSKFTILFEKGSIKQDELIKEYKKINSLASMIIICLSVFMGFYVKEIIIVWTNSQTILGIIESEMKWLLLGNMCLALQVIPYEYMLACGKTKLNLVLSIVYIAYNIGLLPILVRNYGITGAAFSYFILMALSTVVYLIVFYAKYLKSNATSYILVDLLLSILIVVSMAIVSKLLSELLFNKDLFKLMIGVIFGGISVIVVFISKRLIFKRSKKWNIC